MKNMNRLKLIIALLTISITCISVAQEQLPVASESRDTSLEYIGTSNFIVANVVKKCADSFRGGRSSREFILEWQERNAKYVMAAAVYMDRRLEEAYADGGQKARSAVFDAVTAVSREYGNETLRGLFAKGSKQEACNHVLRLIEDGDFDITPKIPMHDKLEALVAWAQQQ